MESCRFIVLHCQRHGTGGGARPILIAAQQETDVNAIRVLIFGLLAAIVISLGTALYYLYSGETNSKKMVRALTIRVVLSLTLFVVLMLAWWFGLISPRGLPPR
jgi:NADH:ubiquinone oxidoreductase subunit 2 (subunit N)